MEIPVRSTVARILLLTYSNVKCNDINATVNYMSLRSSCWSFLLLAEWHGWCTVGNTDSSSLSSGNLLLYLVKVLFTSQVSKKNHLISFHRPVLTQCSKRTFLSWGTVQEMHWWCTRVTLFLYKQFPEENPQTPIWNPIRLILKKQSGSAVQWICW